MQQQVDHVSHVCFIYDLDHLESARNEFSAALGIDDWDGPTELAAFDVMHTQSLSAGIELLAPLTPAGPFHEYLAAHGEGFFALIHGVADVQAAADAAARRGIEPQRDLDGAPVAIDALRIANGEPQYARWAEVLRTYREIPLQPVAGVNIYLGQIEPID